MLINIELNSLWFLVSGFSLANILSEIRLEKVCFRAIVEIKI